MENHLLTTRHYGLDLLRVVSMVAIVLGHFVYHALDSHEGHFYPGGLWNWVLWESIYNLTRVGTNCFILLSGYFLISKYNHRFKGIISVWFQTLFYSVVLYLLAVMCGWGGRFSFAGLISRCHPISSSTYWFVTQYIGLMLLAPFLAKGVSFISKGKYILLLLCLLVLCFKYPFGDLYAGQHSLMWMIFMFLTAGYIRLYDVPNIIQRKIVIWVFVILLALDLAAAIYNICNGYIDKWRIVSTSNDGFVFILALAVFVLFLKIRKGGRVSNLFVRLVPYVFGVYLIHANPDISKVIWKFTKSFLPIVHSTFLYMVLWMVIIYLACCAIDYLRTLLFKITYINHSVDRLSVWLDNKEKDICDNSQGCEHV